jgi:large subunit ribosomal protein L29
MKFNELKALPAAELREKMLELRKELMKENAQVAIGTVPKNPRKLRNAKKTIARIELILSQSMKQLIIQETRKQPMEVSAKK